MKKILSLLFTFCLLYCGAQYDSVPIVRFGFDLGLNYSELGINEAGGTVSTFGGPGFRVGIIADCRINKRYSLIPKAELSFNGAGLSISNPGGASQVKHVYPVTLEFAPHLAIKASDKVNTPFLLVGPSLKTPLVTRAYGYDDVINIKTTTIALDLGFSFDKKMKYFFLSPELRYSLGLNRIRNLDGGSSARFHTVSLLLTFKG
jgi:hypothetical protein